MTSMRANRKMRAASQNEAQVGIGTMIVFIATVLVAAIAAGVLIDTSGKLQERSSRTGNEATEQVSSNLEVQSIIGRRDSGTETGLNDMHIFVLLAPGAKNVDLNQTRIQIQNGTFLKTFQHANTDPPGNLRFYASEERDADSSFTGAAPVMTAGDMVNITIALDTSSARFEPRDEVKIVLVPEVGNKIEVGFSTPTTYGTDKVVLLK